ncbi:tail fiber protein [Flavivirga eckloniae]|uniref:BZIP transcription factor n=1 Tax=Flavivirga eckloniae TaxID=1803846 RepID=A0A2K9PP62_9FLAO|nr:tail fiber protein [Flavivirga eckloniae]AUP78825.1 hypothetical protein C1H87_08975 [Flavivirga eckloniae]
MKKLFLVTLFIGGIGFAQITDTGDKVGIGTANPYQKLHVNGAIGIGLLNGTYIEGFKINYVDGGSGTTTFMSSRWGGDIYFKRSSSEGERTQFSFGGANEHYMGLYNSNNQVKVLFRSGGNSYINGGNVGIGTTAPDMKLAVKGKIHAEEVKIDLNVPAPDYVFKEGYNLISIKELEKFIEENSHLPEMPSAKEFEENGIMQAEMDMNLLKKIEELTLYTIEQQKKIESLEEQVSKVNMLKEENKTLKCLIERITKLEEQLKTIQK